MMCGSARFDLSVYMLAWDRGAPPKRKVPSWWSAFSLAPDVCAHLLAAFSPFGVALPLHTSARLFHHEQATEQGSSQQRPGGNERLRCLRVLHARVRHQLVTTLPRNRATRLLDHIRRKCCRLLQESVKERQHDQGSCIGRPAGICREVGSARRGRAVGSMGACASCVYMSLR